MPINLLASEMNEFLQKYNLSKLFHKEIECLNSPIIIKVPKSIVNKLSPSPQWEFPNSDGFTSDSSRISRNKHSSYTNFYKEKKRQCYPTLSIRPV